MGVKPSTHKSATIQIAPSAINIRESVNAKNDNKKLQQIEATSIVDNDIV
jgi:hypothetical protein